MNATPVPMFTTVQSAAWDSTAAPALSIVVPFHQYDATPLLVDLAAKMIASAESVELVLLDDGSPDPAWFERCAALVRASAVPVKVVRSHRNLGRSGARNALVELSRAPFLLFLDCDMLPDRVDYLARYFAELRSGTVFAYGGRSIARCGAIAPEHELHWYFTKRFEQVSAATRATDPAVYFLSSNFLVRRDVIREIPLDARFQGWGWEDCEWAHRVVASHPLKHIDNSATHLGLIDVATIRRKYQESVANFALVLRTCPALVDRMALYKVARRLASWRLGAPARGITRVLMDQRWLPLAWRARLLQVYKAALYSRVVG